MNQPILDRRGFLAAGAAAVAALGAGCSSSYDVAAGFTSQNGGDGASTIVYWNLLSGGDGSHMQEMEAGYQRQHPEVNLQSTILQWGNPYYTKLAMATRSGSPPDVAIMHLSRINEFGPPGLLTPISHELMAAHGMRPGDFTPQAFRKAQYRGQQLAIPLDTHPFVQYYNTEICGKAGLLDASHQLPPIRGTAALLDALRKIKRTGVTPVVCDQINDPATPWRLFYTFYSQAGGQVLAGNGKRVVLDRALATRVLTFISQLATEGLMNANTDPAGGIASFQAGQAGLYWEGEWNVDVFQAAKLPFSMQPFPAVFGNGVTQADSHTFVVPRKPSPDPEKLSMVLTMIRSLLGQSMIWASGGHIPAWLPTRRSAAYRKLKPQSNYQSVADHVVYDPPAWYSGSGSDMENYAGAAIGSVMLGGLSPASAYQEMRASFEQLSREVVPV
ncbi:MAG: extracellular solute-binding protein [Nocardiopsaceae bacterium]|nr:extracellular solute-binding protein [Nocardiopsaceae bacterium]